MKRITLFLVVTVVLVCAGNVFAVYVNVPNTEDWNVVSNWRVSATVVATTVPASGTNVEIRRADGIKADMYISSGTSALANIVDVGYSSSQGYLEVHNGGSLTTASLMRIGRDKDGTLKVSGGEVYVGTETRLSAAAGATNSLLEITSGSFSTTKLTVPSVTANAKVNLFGGTLTVRDTASVSLLINYGALVGQGIEMKGDGKLIWKGDRSLSLWNPDAPLEKDRGYIYRNLIYTSEAGKSLSYVYDQANNQTVITVVPEPATMAILALGGLLCVRKK